MKRISLLFLIGAVLVGLWAISALIATMEWSRAHWGVLALVVAGCAALAIGLFFRYKHAELREAEVDHGASQFRCVGLQRWPKYCIYCALPVASWRLAGIHQQVKCWRDLESESAPGSGWKVDDIEVVDDPQNGTEREAVES